MQHAQQAERAPPKSRRRPVTHGGRRQASGLALRGPMARGVPGGRYRRRDWLLTAVLALAAPAIPAQGEAGNAAAGPSTPPLRVLGELDFPTTTDSKAAQAAFESGTLLLHLFEYSLARTQFQRARRIDRDFAMAYWGEAMTHNHPIWDRQDREKARAVLAELGDTPEQRRQTTDSKKERDYLKALEILADPR